MSAKLASALGTDCMSKLILHPVIHLLELVPPRNAVSFAVWFFGFFLHDQLRQTISFSLTAVLENQRGYDLRSVILW